MTDSTSEDAHARAALSAPGTVLDKSLLGAVHNGLLSVPVETQVSQDVRSSRSALASRSGPSSQRPAPDDLPQLAVRRRGVI